MKIIYCHHGLRDDNKSQEDIFSEFLYWFDNKEFVKEKIILFYRIIT